MSERIRGGYDDALYKSTFTLLYFTLHVNRYFNMSARVRSELLDGNTEYIFDVARPIYRKQ